MFTTRMRRNLIWTFGWTAAVGVLVVALTALTYGQRGGDGRGRGRGGFDPFSSALLTAIDGNGDGVVSADEMAAAPASLKVLDLDGDGRLAGAELMPAGRGAGRGFRGRGDEPGETPPTSASELTDILMGFDDNADGRLTVAEVPERFRGLFDRADTNKDGALTADEIKASAAATPEPSEGEGRGRGGRGRGGPVDPLLTALDTDRDGALSADELKQAPEALRTLDRNADGRLTIDETFTGPGRRQGGSGLGV